MHSDEQMAAEVPTHAAAVEALRFAMDHWALAGFPRIKSTSISMKHTPDGPTVIATLHVEPSEDK